MAGAAKLAAPCVGARSTTCSAEASQGGTQNTGGIHRGLAGQGWGVPVALDKAAGPCARFLARRAFLRVRALVTGVEAAGEDSAVGAERTACFGDDWAGRDGEGGAGHSMIPIRQSPLCSTLSLSSSPATNASSRWFST
jgi:hypothetical protein